MKASSEDKNMSMTFSLLQLFAYCFRVLAITDLWLVCVCSVRWHLYNYVGCPE